MIVNISCDACPYRATMFLGVRPLCSFCARRIIFDTVRTSHDVRFTNGREVGGLHVIDFAIKKGAKCYLKPAQ